MSIFDTTEFDTLEAAPRSDVRRFQTAIVITATTALTLGLTLKMPTQLEANDISRWCTVWSLVERGTYAIDDCPWQNRTQDKVKKVAPFQKAAAGKAPVEHYYSSKPPLLPTLIAGILYPVRRATGVPLDAVVERDRHERYVQIADKSVPGGVRFEKRKPEDKVKWPVLVLYLKPMVVLLNVVPSAAFLVLFARLLDRRAENDWAYIFSLYAAALGTLLLVFDQTLNNHTVAAYAGFFAWYSFLKIWSEGARGSLTFASAGFWAAFCACNELPAALFGILLFLTLLVRFPRQTLLSFATAAALPCAAFLATQYAAFGQFRPVYEEFGTKSYQYEGSYWNAPLEMDYLNVPKVPATRTRGPIFQESHPLYLFHMTLGHHGVFSLSPIFLLSAAGAFRGMLGRLRGMRAAAFLTTILTVALLAFYDWNPKARNYGGSTQGLRWLFWLIPFWLTFLPAGVARGQTSRLARFVSLAALFGSAFSVGYALHSPWSHPWILDFMEHAGLYELRR